MSLLKRRTRANEWTTAAAPILACAALFAGGCAHLPKTGAEATGEPLSIDARTEQRQYVGQRKVGEVVNRDRTGRVVATSEMYQNEIVQYDVTRWQAFQGDYLLDDQDFFRIAGDTMAAEEIASIRDSGVSINRTGFIVLGIGVAAFVGGLVIGQALKQDPNPVSGIDNSPTWPNLLAGAGVITGLVGGSVAWYGAAKANRQHPVDDPRRAKRAADKYNATLGPAAVPPPPPPPAPRPNEDVQIGE